MSEYDDEPEIDQTTIEVIALTVHEANRGLQMRLLQQHSPHWENTPLDIRESAIQGVKRALTGASPEQLHQSWMEHKIDQGWRYGPIKDAEAKTHPCLVPYHRLPDHEKLKDTLFSVIVDLLREV